MNKNQRRRLKRRRFKKSSKKKIRTYPVEDNDPEEISSSSSGTEVEFPTARRRRVTISLSDSSRKLGLRVEKNSDPWTLSKVSQSSLSYERGARVGDVIRRINNQEPPPSFKSLKQKLRGRPIVVELSDPGSYARSILLDDSSPSSSSSVISVDDNLGVVDLSVHQSDEDDVVFMEPPAYEMRSPLSRISDIVQLSPAVLTESDVEMIARPIALGVPASPFSPLFSASDFDHSNPPTPQHLPPLSSSSSNKRLRRNLNSEFSRPEPSSLSFSSSPSSSPASSSSSSSLFSSPFPHSLSPQNSSSSSSSSRPRSSSNSSRPRLRPNTSPPRLRSNTSRPRQQFNRSHYFESPSGPSPVRVEIAGISPPPVNLGSEAPINLVSPQRDDGQNQESNRDIEPSESGSSRSSSRRSSFVSPNTRDTINLIDRRADSIHADEEFAKRLQAEEDLQVARGFAEQPRQAAAHIPALDAFAISPTLQRMVARRQVAAPVPALDVADISPIIQRMLDRRRPNRHFQVFDQHPHRPNRRPHVDEHSFRHRHPRRPDLRHVRGALRRQMLSRGVRVNNILSAGSRDFNANDYEALLALDASPQRGASGFTMESLPTNVLNDGEEQGQCCICLEDMTKGDKIKRLPCMHPFHVDCIDQWLRQNGSCPIDKKKI